MIFSKKLSIAVILALSVQLSTGAFFSDIQSKKTIILNFAQDLRNQNNSQAQKIAQWLEQQAIAQSESNEAIISIITNNDLTEKSKIMLLRKIIAQEKRDTIKDFMYDIRARILATAFLFLHT
ncbi:MAG TPA: hypothetical protein VJJ26_05205, partial [Candidatus Babeliales bacterium]|nr:hypothetical protein [Candidatus Babeliales bacterium]